MITFHHPPTGTNNPLRDFQPNNQNHYPGNVPGIYIYGIRTKVEGDLKFVPLVVGESESLTTRVYNGHYLKKFRNPFLISTGQIANQGDKKETWDFSRKDYLVQEIQSIYDQILRFDGLPSKNTNNQRVKKAVPLDRLLYYQQANFFDLKYFGFELASTGYNLRIEESLTYLMQLGLNQVVNTGSIADHLQKLTDTLENFNENFYFVYADSITSNNGGQLDLSNENDRKRIELLVKQRLSADLGINTSAKANGDPANIQINISQIRTDLINVGGHQFVDPNGVGGYMNPLIL